MPDPRNARGQCSPWELLLTVVAAALASDQPHRRAISQWVHERSEELTDVLGPAHSRIPSKAPLRPARQAVDVVALDAFVQALGPTGATDDDAGRRGHGWQRGARDVYAWSRRLSGQDFPIALLQERAVLCSR